MPLLSKPIPIASIKPRLEPTHSSTMKNFIAVLPVELWREIQLNLDSQTLAWFSSSSRRCRDLARPILFRTLVIKDHYRIQVVVEAFILFLTLHPEIAVCVRALTLDGCPLLTLPSSSKKLKFTLLSCVLRLLPGIQELSLRSILLDDVVVKQHIMLTGEEAKPRPIVNLRRLTVDGRGSYGSRWTSSALIGLYTLFGTVEDLVLDGLTGMPCQCVVEDGVGHSTEWWHDAGFGRRIFELQAHNMKMSVKTLSVFNCENLPLQLMLGFLERTSPQLSSIKVFSRKYEQMQVHRDLNRLCAARSGVLRDVRVENCYRERQTRCTMTFCSSAHAASFSYSYSHRF